MSEHMRTICYITATLVSANLMVSTPPDEVSVPDPALNVAIREALQKPGGPLTEQDLLTLTNLNPAAGT
jgi:hypothetical protein